MVSQGAWNTKTQQEGPVVPFASEQALFAIALHQGGKITGDGTAGGSSGRKRVKELAGLCGVVMSTLSQVFRWGPGSYAEGFDKGTICRSAASFVRAWNVMLGMR